MRTAYGSAGRVAQQHRQHEVGQAGDRQDAAGAAGGDEGAGLRASWLMGAPAAAGGVRCSGGCPLLSAVVR